MGEWSRLKFSEGLESPTFSFFFNRCLEILIVRLGILLLKKADAILMTVDKTMVIVGLAIVCGLLAGICLPARSPSSRYAW